MGKDKKWSEKSDEEQDAMSDAEALDSFYSEIEEDG